MSAYTKKIPEDYPRIREEKSPYYGCLDDTTLVPHTQKISFEKFKELIHIAIDNANKKSSRKLLSIPDNVTDDELQMLYKQAGKKLFSYFKKYCGDPASTAHQTNKKHYKEVAIEQFRNQTLQKERMNSGWRYQFLASECAHHSRRFKSISDIGSSEADFNATIEFLQKNKKPLSLYVSVKNRSNTLGGQDWPKAIHALEAIAKNDKNRVGPYCCVFGMAMDRGMRYIKCEQKTKHAHSVNTEIWLSDFFWPFFSNYSYQEVMKLVLEVLISMHVVPELSTQIEVPDPVLNSFGESCKKAGLLDENGCFDDPFKLVNFFCNK